MKPIKIRIAGFMARNLVIDGVHMECGQLRDDIGIHMEGQAGGVMSWDDFEAAYFEVKRLRGVGLVQGPEQEPKP